MNIFFKIIKSPKLYWLVIPALLCVLSVFQNDFTRISEVHSGSDLYRNVSADSIYLHRFTAEEAVLNSQILSFAPGDSLDPESIITYALFDEENTVIAIYQISGAEILADSELTINLKSSLKKNGVYYYALSTMDNLGETGLQVSEDTVFLYDNSKVIKLIFIICLILSGLFGLFLFCNTIRKTDKKDRFDAGRIFTGFMMIQFVIAAGLVINCAGSSDTLVFRSVDPAYYQNQPLEAGTYCFDVRYASEEFPGFGTLISESDIDAIKCDSKNYMYSWKNTQSERFMVTEDVSDAKWVEQDCEGIDYSGFSLYSTTDHKKIVLICFILLSLIADFVAAWCIWLFNKAENKTASVIRFVLVTLSGMLPCIISFDNSLVHGYDMYFHLHRIEGIAEGLMTGQFPVRVYPNLLDGAGYPASIFYGDYFLYIPAFFRIMGFTVQAACNLYIVIVSMFAAFLGWYSFSQIFKNKWAPIVSVFLFQCMNMKMDDLYVSGAIGRHAAEAFMIPALCGYLIILHKGREEHTKGELMLGLSVSGILLSHNITVFLVLLMLFVLTCFNIPALFKDRRIIGFIKAAAIALVTSAFWWIPFLDYSLTRDYGVSSNLLAGEGLHILADRLAPASLNPLNGYLGLLPVAGFASGIILMFACRRSLSKEKKYFVIICLIIFAVSAYISSIYCPWEKLADNISLFRTVGRVIQFPRRFAIISLLLSTYLGGIFIEEIPKEKKHLSASVAGAVIAVSAAAALVYGVHLKNDSDYIHMYDRGSFSLYVGYGFEESFYYPDIFYFPTGIDTDAFRGIIQKYVRDSGIPEDSIYMDFLNRTGMRFSATIVNSNESDYDLFVPYVWCRDFVAYDGDGNALETYKGEGAKLMVRIPAGYSGKISVCFREKWYWRLSEVISLFGMIFIVVSKKVIRR